MRIAIIGIFNKGSYAEGIAKEVNKTHTACLFQTDGWHTDNGAINISEILDGENIDGIIVNQSHIHIHNDTDIPLLLMKQENGALTVDNPTYIFRKYGIYYGKQVRIGPEINPSVNLYRYDPTRNKDIMLADIPWHPLPFEDYRDILERSQFVIIQGHYLEVRCLEAMACKTIPIIIYDFDYYKEVYEKVGITEDVAYFVQYKNAEKRVIIKKYDKTMAERGRQLVIDKFQIKDRAKQMIEVLENGN